MASRLRNAREAEGVSRAELARRSGVSERTLQRAEAGDDLSTVTKHKIIKAFNKLPDGLRVYTISDLFRSSNGTRRQRSNQ